MHSGVCCREINFREAVETGNFLPARLPVGRTDSRFGGVTWSAACQNARTELHSESIVVRTVRLPAARLSLLRALLAWPSEVPLRLADCSAG